MQVSSLAKSNVIVILMACSIAVYAEVPYSVVDLGFSLDASEAYKEYRIDNWDPKAVSCAMNNKGQVVVYDPIKRCSFLIDPNNPEKRLSLGGIPGFDYACASSINDLGQIVGYAFESSKGGITPPKACAIIFDPNGTGKNKSLGIKENEWSSYAFCINNKSRIVGMTYFHSTRVDRSVATLFGKKGSRIFLTPALIPTLPKQTKLQPIFC